MGQSSSKAGATKAVVPKAGTTKAGTTARSGRGKKSDIVAVETAKPTKLAKPAKLVEAVIDPAEAMGPVDAADPVHVAVAVAVAADADAGLDAYADHAGPDAEMGGPDYEEAPAGLVQEARTWQDDGWTAQVIKNEDDDGWAVAMTLDGEPEPSLVGPWTMGRDKKNPKPLDSSAFNVLVKTAYEVRRRHEQHMYALLNKSVFVDEDDGRIRVTLEIIPDEYEPHAILRGFDALGELLAEVKVPPDFRLNVKRASAWIAAGYERPQGD